MSVDWNIHFRWVTRGAGGRPSLEKLRLRGVDYARLIVRDIALSARDDVYRRARTALRQSITKIVRQEVQRMAQYIGRHLPTPDKYAGPYGEMSLFADALGDPERSYGTPLSRQAQELGWSTKWNRSQSGIKWAKRDRYYLKRKRREGTSGHWFRRTGELQAFLMSRKADWYFGAFGNIRVRFTKSFSDNVSGRSVTRSSAPGRLSSTVQVGRLDVSYFGNITPTMMPGLANMTPVSNPLPHEGVSRLLPHNEQTWKLHQPSQGYVARRAVDVRVPADRIHRALWRKSYRMKKVWQNQTVRPQHRPAIDPFVSFYMTRAIPNAIWRRTERFVEVGR